MEYKPRSHQSRGVTSFQTRSAGYITGFLVLSDGMVLDLLSPSLTSSPCAFLSSTPRDPGLPLWDSTWIATREHIHFHVKLYTILVNIPHIIQIRAQGKTFCVSEQHCPYISSGRMTSCTFILEVLVYSVWSSGGSTTTYSMYSTASM